MGLKKISEFAEVEIFKMLTLHLQQNENNCVCVCVCVCGETTEDSVSEPLGFSSSHDLTSRYKSNPLDTLSSDTTLSNAFQNAVL